MFFRPYLNETNSQMLKEFLDNIQWTRNNFKDGPLILEIKINTIAVNFILFYFKKCHLSFKLA